MDDDCPVASHLAQVNLARMRFRPGSAPMREFIAAWVPEGHRPAPAEALARLRHLRTYGPTPQAFTLRRRFTSTGRRETRR